MEQIIEVFGIDWRLIAVQMLNFGVLLFILSHVLYKPMVRLIEHRRAQILQGVADAERASRALRDADAKKSEILTTAILEGERLIVEARERAKRDEMALMRLAHEKQERLLKEASLKAEEVHRRMMQEAKEEVARMVVLGVEKTVRTSAQQTVQAP
jgi:F-type H+-transporting ATPase subunit b